jgi:hypothetical protein
VVVLVVDIHLHPYLSLQVKEFTVLVVAEVVEIVAVVRVVLLEMVVPVL